MAKHADRTLPQSKDRASQPGFLAGLNALETIIVAVIALMALAGILMITKGLILKSDGALFGATPALEQQSMPG